MSFFSMLKEAISGPQVDVSALISEGALVLDVRTKDEYRQGHAKGSINIPLHTLDHKLSSLKGKTVILVCRSGARAGQAKSMLEANGVVAHNAGAWQSVATHN